MMKYKRTQGGAALLVAVLMTSVMLSVGLGVYQRTYKELYLSSFWKQTQIAFAAADAGLECALYWDLHQATNYTCFNNSSAWSSVNPGTWTLPDLTITGGGCAKVTITKPSPTGSSSRIESRGYNTCDTNNPRRVERALSIDY